MALPSTKPLDGEFWYVLDDAAEIEWKPRPKLRGDFYLGWLGQAKNVVGVGLVRMEEGKLSHICTHGTPYYWLQPFEVLPFTSEALQDKQLLGSDSMALDFSLGGWGLRDQTPPRAFKLPDTPISDAVLEPLLSQAVANIVRDFRSEGEPKSKNEYDGLLTRAAITQSQSPLERLLNLLKTGLGEANVIPVLTELVKHDVNVLPGYRRSDFFENLPIDREIPSPSSTARLVLSAIYHLAPLLGSQRLNGVLLLNCLRQRHPFDVTWGADFLIKCFGMANLVRLLRGALVKEEKDQIRGNVLDLLQELGYGISVGFELEILKGLSELSQREQLGAFGQVVDSHRAYIEGYLRQRDAAAHQTG